MAKIKKGTYRFNDELTAPSETIRGGDISWTASGYIQGVGDITGYFSGLSVYVTDGSVTNIVSHLVSSVPDLSGYGVIYPKEEDVFNNSGWNYQTITIPYDQDVSDAFEPWFTANTKLVGGDAVTIEYNGNVIASFTHGTKAIRCNGAVMQGDVVVNVPEQIGGGSGGGGECDREHIIEVAELPTENIEDNAVYKCGDSYSKYYSVLVTDIVVGAAGEGVSFAAMLRLPADFCHYYFTPTRPTENIAISSDTNGYHIYYVEDENDILIYGELGAPGENIWVSLADSFSIPVIGMVADVSETTEQGLYAVDDSGWHSYMRPSGSLTITENGTHDVSGKAEAVVDIPVPSGSLTITENGTHDVSGYARAEVAVPGEVVEVYDGSIEVV